MKILLIQLPLPHHTLKAEWGNIPLAAGYLKATCHNLGLLEKVDIEILDERDSNLSGDAKLVDIILSKSPDILGFSLYCWNSVRSLFIAKNIKRKLPNVKIIVGGPEVNTESKYILDNPLIDIGCIGEGEFIFVEIINHLLQKNPRLKDINGIFYKKSNRTIITPPRPAAKTLDVIPSPYLLGIINPKDYDTIWIETKRGCPYGCTYCWERLRPMRFFSLDRIRKELQFAISKRIPYIYFLDSSFLSNPNYKKICKIIKNLNAKKESCITVALRAENLNRGIVDLLKDCGVGFIELGLQSYNPIVLKNINRPTNIKKFIDGVCALKKKNIGFAIDLIIGLPGETLKSFKETVRFLKNNKLISHADVFLLEILPGTKLKIEKDKYGIEYRERPPYSVIMTNSLSESDIKKCHEIFKKAKHKKRDVRLGHYSLSVLPTSHLRINYPYQEDPDKRRPFNININQLDFPITKMIIELDAKKRILDRLNLLGKKLRRKVSNPLTIWFISQDIELNFKSIKYFLKCISMPNHYLAWNIFLETQSAFNLSIIDKIKKCIISKDNFLDNPIKIFTIFPLKENRLNNKWLDELSKIVTYFWHIEFIEKTNWKKELEQILKGKDKLFIADFHSDATIYFIVEVLKFIRDKRKNNYFLFKNIAIKHLQKKDDDFMKREVPVPRKLNECILRFDKEFQLSSYVLPNIESMRDITTWRYAVLKKANYLTLQ